MGKKKIEEKNDPVDITPVAGLNLYQKLNRIQAEIETAPQSGHNKFSGYYYSTEDDIMSVLRPLLIKYSIAIICTPVKHGTWRQVTTSKGKIEFIEEVRLKVKIVNADNPEEKESIVVYGYGQDGGDKGTYIAYTGAKKYGLSMMFLISSALDAGHDKESGDNVSGNNTQRPPQNQNQRPPARKQQQQRPVNQINNQPPSAPPAQQQQTPPPAQKTFAPPVDQTPAQPARTPFDVQGFINEVLRSPDFGTFTVKEESLRNLDAALSGSIIVDDKKKIVQTLSQRARDLILQAKTWNEIDVWDQWLASEPTLKMYSEQSRKFIQKAVDTVHAGFNNKSGETPVENPAETPGPDTADQKVDPGQPTFTDIATKFKSASEAEIASLSEEYGGFIFALGDAESKKLNSIIDMRKKILGKI